MDSTSGTRRKSKRKIPELICGPSSARECLTATGAMIRMEEVTGKIILGGEEFTLPVSIFTNEQFLAIINQTHFPREIECRVDDHIYPFFSPKGGNAEIADPPPDVKIEKAKLREGQSVLSTLFLDYLKVVATNVLGGMNIILHHRLPSAFHAPIRSRENVLHFFLECLPAPKFAYINPVTAFSIPIGTDAGFHACLLPSPVCGIILSDGDHDVVQVIGNNIYVLFDPFLLYDLGGDAALLIFRKTVALAINGWIKRNELNAITVEQSQGLNVDNIQELASAFVLEHKTHTLAQLQSQEHVVRECEERVREAKRVLARIRQFWMILEEGGLHRYGAERLMLDHARIMEHPLVCSATIIPGKGFQVATKTIIISHEGKKYRIGRFTIHFELDGTLLIWVEESFHPTGEPHPHCSAHNGPCFGNIGTAIDDALAEHQYADALHYILLWLESYTPELVIWHKIDEWPLDDIESFQQLNAMEVVQ